MANTHVFPQDYLPKALKPYYGGQFHDVKDGSLRDILSAANGSTIAKVAYAGAQDTAAAIVEAKKAQMAWADTKAADRGLLLRKAAQIIRQHALELATLDAYNIGSPINVMAGDAVSAADQIEFFAGLIPAITGETHDLSNETFNYTVREPLGVVARIVASNHPIMFTAAKMAAPLAMGNVVIMKPPEQAPLSALRLAELIGDVFPPGVLSVLPGAVECGSTLATHPNVAKITLIGSAAVGRLIQKQSAATLKQTLFELGGKNALVAYPDADQDTLVQGIVAGMNWGWCGQSCGSLSRVFLHNSIHDEVLTRAADIIASKFRPGNPLNPQTNMGAMVSREAQERVISYIAIGKAEGAKVVIGGGVPNTQQTRGGYYVQPTVLSNVTQGMRVAREEIFGPVMSVIRWSGDEDELFRQVNSVEYGLTGAVFTTNIKTMHRASRKMQAGTVWVNTVAKHFLGMPFGGYKQSGLGREECFDELLAMTQPKAIHIQL